MKEVAALSPTFFQLDIRIGLMGKWVLRFDETYVISSNSFNNDMGFDFANGEHI